jgi:hypothetical protein
LKYQNYDKLQLMLDETNRVLLIKEKLIEDLNAKIIEIGSKIKEGEILIKELKVQNNCQLSR